MMKYFNVKYNGVNVGTFSLFQVLNGFEDFEFQLIELTPHRPCRIEKMCRYLYTMKLKQFTPTYPIRIKR